MRAFSVSKARIMPAVGIWVSGSVDTSSDRRRISSSSCLTRSVSSVAREMLGVQARLGLRHDRLHCAAFFHHFAHHASQAFPGCQQPQSCRHNVSGGLESIGGRPQLANLLQHLVNQLLQGHACGQTPLVSTHAGARGCRPAFAARGARRGC